MNHAHQTISQLCSDLGKDPLLVQGAGGNVSWKENDVLWIKGSGTWLANADKEDIFVPVDLNHLQTALHEANFKVTPKVVTTQTEQKLRPSIETVLHALMPQKIVVHLHAITALSHLVTLACKENIDALFQHASTPSIQYAFVDYHKPGPELAQAIQESLKYKPNANVVFLKNHGIVLGAESIEGIYQLLQELNAVCAAQSNPVETTHLPSTNIHSEDTQYIPFPDTQVQQLALNASLFNRLQSDWVLYPDHAVFLGSKAFIYDSWADFKEQQDNDNPPELIFIKNTGVFIKPDFNMAKIAQLRCYYDVVSRVSPDAKLDPLSEEAVHALLNWDAEKLRQQMSK